MPRTPKFRWWWLALSLAPACTAPQPGLPPAGGSAAPSATPSSLPPSQAPEAGGAPDGNLPLLVEGEEPEALPSDSFDLGDASEAEGEELRTALTEGGAELYLPGDLIHDGGVILYHLNQAQPVEATPPRASLPLARPAREEAKAPSGKERPKARPGLALGLGLGAECLAPDELPERWQRGQFIPGGRHTRLRKEGPQGVRATVEATNRGSLRFTRPGKNQGVDKRYNERLHREFLFQRLQGKLRLQALGPLLLNSQSPQSRLAFQDITVRSNTQAEALVAWPAGGSDLQAVAGLPTVAPLSQLVVSVRLKPGTDCPPYLFAHFLSQRGARDRIPLRDDGLDGDATAGDGQFSALVSVPPGTGLAHLAVEALASTSFLPKGKAEGTAVGLSLQVREDAPKPSPSP